MTPIPRPALGTDETVLWQGKPKKSAFIATKSLSLLPIAALWLAFDLTFIASSFSDESAPLFLLVPFFALHLLPVWLWLGSLLTAKRRYKNTFYYLTNRRVIIREGVFSPREVSLYYKDLRITTARVGILDRPFHVGDIVFHTGTYTHGRYGRRESLYSFEELEDHEAVYERLQRILSDAQSDA